MSTAELHPFDLLRQIEQRCGEAARKTKNVSYVATRGTGLLAIRLREQLFTLPLTATESIEPVPAYTPVPGVQHWLLGIANLRGVVITITDLGALLFGDPSPQYATRRLIVAAYDGWQYGLLVDEVIGLRRFETAPVEADPLLDEKRLRRYVNEQRRVGGRLWFGLDLQALLQDQAFQNAALRGPSAPE